MCLTKHKGLCSLSSIISAYFKNLDILSAIYFLVGAVWIIFSWIPGSLEVVEKFNSKTGVYITYVVFSFDLIVISTIMLILFFSYVIIRGFLRLYKSTPYKKAKRAILVITFCLAITSILDYLFASILPLKSIFISRTLIVTTHLIPFTILAITLLETPLPHEVIKPIESIKVKGGFHIILLYDSKSFEHKMDVFANYIREGVYNNEFVIYRFYENDPDVVIDALEKRGLNVRKLEEQGVLMLCPVAEYYLRNGVLNKDSLLKTAFEIKNSVFARGFKQLRSITDVGNPSTWLPNVNSYFDYLAEIEELVLDESTISIRAFSIEGLDVNLLKKLKIGSNHVRSIYIDEDYTIDHLNAFSSKLGLSHRDTAGLTVLLEYDPSSNFELPLIDLSLIHI